MSHELNKSNICPRCGTATTGGDPSIPCPACLMKIGLESWSGSTPPTGSEIANTPTHASRSFEAPLPEEIAARFPQFELLELIGHGGMGAVYKARQTTLDRIIALKIIRPDVEQQQGFAERFSREAKTLARLNHSNIVTIHDFGASDGLYYLVMEYVEGVNLREMMHEHLDSSVALRIIPEICDALHYAHEQGVIHRDIKPENILIDARGRVKIADFGLAKLIGGTLESSGLTKSRQVMGTWQYMAPEQMQGTKQVDHRADIYSLGVILYEMLTGEVPQGIFDPPSKKVSVDVRLDEIVLRALAREPDRRYQTASAVKIDVQKISSGSAEPIAPAGRFPSRPAARGISTIMERQVSNLWHWVAATPEETIGQRAAALPVSLLLLACLIGIATIFAPWVIISGPELSSSLVLKGSDVSSSSFTVAGFALVAVLSAAIPSRKPMRIWQAGLLTLAAGFVVFTMFLFNEILVFHPITDRFGNRIELRNIEFYRNFQPAYFCSLAAGVVSLILSAMSFRHVGSRSREEDSKFRLSGGSGPLRNDVQAGFPPPIPRHETPVIRDDQHISGVGTRESQQHGIPARPDAISPTKAPGIALMLYAVVLLIMVAGLLVNGLLMILGVYGAGIREVGAAILTLGLLLMSVVAVVLRGGWHLVSREKYQAALLGSFLGQPVGIWGLLTLGRPGVKESFRDWQEQAGDSAAPRVSRRAILGAVWALLVIFVPLAFAPMGKSAPWQIPLQFTLGPLGIVAPFATTILGWLALGDIRRSEGKITGRGLAFFDAVLFPTLIVNSLILALVTLFYKSIGDSSIHLALLILGFGIPICGIVDTVVIRRLWNATSGRTGREHSESAVDTQRSIVPRFAWILLVIAILGIMLMFVILPAGTDTKPAVPLDNAPVLKAAVHNDLKSVRQLLERGHPPETHLDGYDQPLWWAALHGNGEMVRELLNIGVNVDMWGEHGITPLMIASYLGHADVVNELVIAKADINRKSSPQQRPLQLTAAGRPYLRIDWPQASHTPLTLAAMQGHTEVGRILLENGADPSIRDSNGLSALQLAEQFRHGEFVTMMFQYAGDEFGPNAEPAADSDAAQSP